MRRWREFLYALLLASVVIPTLPRLVDLVREARRLLPLSVAGRREQMMSDFYPAIETIAREVPADKRIALIPATRDDRSDSVFINYYLYPHPTKIYYNRWQYQLDRFKPDVIVSMTRTPRVMSYADLRNLDVRRSRIVRDIQLPAETRVMFAIPIVTSTDGAPQVAYTIEGALASEDEAQVTLTLQPANIAKRLTIRGTRTFYDLVYECFGVTEFAAWVQVSSDRPVRSAFWLVNRTARVAAPLRLIDGPLKGPAPFPVVPKANLWLLNLGDDYTVAHAGSHPALVPARTVMAINATGTVTGRVYAFITQRESNGQTRFMWPEDLR